MIERLTALFDRRPRTAEAWLARLRRPRVGARDQAAFQTWLEQDDGHLEAYEAAKSALAGLEPLRNGFGDDLARLRARGTARPAPRRLILAGGLTAAAAAVAAAAVLWPATLSRPQIYESAPGHILDVALADGSKITLDAGSAVSVALADDARRVALVRGAAYFDIAHDAAHPFQVAVADRRVIVTGTRFAVSLRDDRAEVSLLEGRVAIGRRDVRERDALAAAVALTPGQRADFAPGGQRIVVQAADVEAATAWREGRLVFHDAPLATVIAEAGRYADADMVVADPRLARVRVTAVLPLTGEEALIDRMDRLLPITVEHTSDGRALIRAE